MRLSRVSALLGVSAASLLLAGTGLAQATTPDAGQSAPQNAPAAAPPEPYGTVIEPTGLNTRQYPSTDSAIRQVLEHQQQVGLDCKVRAQSQGGNDVWYKLRDQEEWASARFMDNTGEVPYCIDAHPTRMSQQEMKESREAKG